MKRKPFKLNRFAISRFPYLPNRPEWDQIPWDKARDINPEVSVFIGHDDNCFYFEVRGSAQIVRIAK